MEPQVAHILLVESDPQVSEVIAQQILRPSGYHVDVFESASSVIKEIHDLSPDLIITNLHLPGFSGKDLLIALTSQGIDLPVIVISPKGHENDALQAFRLGAVNFLTYPIREAEVVSVVEDTLNRRRKRDELIDYSRRLEQISEGIEQRIRDFAEIFSIGKLAPSSASQQSLYEKITSASQEITRADSAWLLALDPTSGRFILHACRNTDDLVQSRLHLPYENSLSSLVATSSQTISIHGEAVKRFNLNSVESVLVVPLKHDQNVIGMVAVERKTPQPFTSEQKALLEMIAGYAASLLDNFIRFQELEKQLSTLQQSSIYSRINADIKNDLLAQAGMEIHNRGSILIENLDALVNPGIRKLSSKQSKALDAIQEEANLLMVIADSMASFQQSENTIKLENVDINKIIRDVINRFQAIAQDSRITIKLDLPLQPTIVTVFSSQITKVIEGLLSNALKHSPPKSKIILRVEKNDDGTLISVHDAGEGIDESLADSLYEKRTSRYHDEARQFGGIGISLLVVKEIVSAHRGKIWINSGKGKGFTISISLPQ